MQNQEWFNSLPIAPISSWQPVSGGDINEAYQVIADGIPYFIKVQPNQSQEYFAHERRGLQELGTVINTPTPIASGDIDHDAYLILNWLTEGPENQSALGTAVAKMHQKHHDQFGFYTNHHTKSLIKDNSWNNSWSDFYINQRLIPEVKVAQQKHRWECKIFCVNF